MAEIVDIPGVSATLPSKKLLNTGFRIITDTLQNETFTRIDIKINDTQHSIAFNSSRVGQSILSTPQKIACLAVNVSLKEIISKLKELISQIETTHGVEL